MLITWFKVNLKSIRQLDCLPHRCFRIFVKLFNHSIFGLIRQPPPTQFCHFFSQSGPLSIHTKNAIKFTSLIISNWLKLKQFFFVCLSVCLFVYLSVYSVGRWCHAIENKSGHVTSFNLHQNSSKNTLIL
jgi:hypothetical protein